MPINQLVMMKLLINQTLLAPGPRPTQILGTVFDGIARHTPKATPSSSAPPPPGSSRRCASATSPSATSAPHLQRVACTAARTLRPLVRGCAAEVRVHRVVDDEFAFTEVGQPTVDTVKLYVAAAGLRLRFTVNCSPNV